MKINLRYGKQINNYNTFAKPKYLPELIKSNPAFLIISKSMIKDRSDVFNLNKFFENLGALIQGWRKLQNSGGATETEILGAHCSSTLKIWGPWPPWPPQFRHP